MDDFSTDEINLKSIVARIDGLLSDKGQKRPELYKAVGISTSSFSEWPKKNTMPSIDKVFKIANYFGVSIKWLVTGVKDIAITKKQQEFLEKYENISELALKIALAADILNDAGKKAALSMVEGLEKDFPLALTSSVDAG